MSARGHVPDAEVGARWRLGPVLRRAIRLAIGAAIVVYLLTLVPLGELGAAVARAAPLALLLALALGLAAQLTIADRLRRLAAGLGVRLSLGALFRVNLGALFYALFLPGGDVSGVLARLYQMARSERHYAEVGVALATERVLAVLTMSLVGVIAWLVAWPGRDWPVFWLMLAAFLVLLAVQGAAFMLPTGFGLGRLGAWAKTRALIDAVRRCRSLRLRLWLQVFAIGIATHLLGIAAYGLVAHGLELELSWTTIAWTRTAALLAAILPFSVGGLGVREGALVVLLTPYGVTIADALGYGLLTYATTILGVGLIGGMIEGRRWLWPSASEPGP